MNLETQLQDGERDARPHLEGHGAARRPGDRVRRRHPHLADIGLTTLIALFGAFALVSGVATIAGAFSVPDRGR